MALFLKLLALVVGIVLLVIAAGWRGQPVRALSDCWDHGVPRGPYVAGNRKAFESAPIFPGSVLVAEQSFGIHRGTDACLAHRTDTYDGPPFSAYWTTRRYRVPADVSDQRALRFFASALRRSGWTFDSAPAFQVQKCIPDPHATSDCHYILRRDYCEASYTRNRVLLSLDICPHRLANRGEISATVDYLHGNHK